MLVLSISLAFLAITLFSILRRKSKQPNKIFNVYSQPGKWFTLKYYVFLFMLMVRRFKYRFLDKSQFFKPDQLDKLQPLSNHELACDAVFFQFVSQDGIYYCSGIERRQEGKCAGLIYLVLPEYGILCNEKIPSTVMDADPKSLFSMEYYGAEGISFTPVESMKKWRVSYKGKMRQESNPQNVVNVELDGIWQSDYPWVLFEVDTPAHVLAKAFATEEWSREYFEKLKETHQSHYEQMGYFSGKLNVNGTIYELDNLDAFRDHSFSFKRDWSIMHRYIYHMFYLKDGTKISVGVVSQPSTSSNLLVGYVARSNKTVDMIDECDLKLYQHGENGKMPTELCFMVTANKKTYEIQVKYLHQSVHFKGRNKEARINERFLECIVNGVPGRGISEWHYNNN
ncbi:unnamed protein product [Callosobruchus maculatus]|uniref:DUF7064 domain-containing protein n=1 Tax=Callosobruchus maculatus TaxID=64391 RepID=A0A653BL25_CALMS|nr:unnamed protein product [Callosobruchus maculatus]